MVKHNQTIRRQIADESGKFSETFERDMSEACNFTRQGLHQTYIPANILSRTRLDDGLAFSLLITMVNNACRTQSLI